jgi:hypothetical protein
LRRVTLENCFLFTRDPFRLGYPDSPASQVTDLDLRQVNWGNADEDHLGQMAFGPGAALRTLSYYGDEDDIEISPETFTFDACPHLSQVDVHVCGWWAVRFQGDLPRLDRIGISSQRHGDHYMSFDAIGDGSSAYALSLRDGQGPFAGQRFLFLGDFRYLNLAKATRVITQLSGEVVDEVSPALTYAVLGEEEHAAHEAGTPSAPVAEIEALVEQGAAIEIVDDSRLRGWIIDGWY